MDLLGIETQLSPAEQARLREVRELVQQQLRTQSVEYWNKEAFPAELVRTLGDAGLGGLQLQPGSQLLRGLIHAEIARADISLSSVVGIHNELIVGMIDSLGSQEQKDTWLPRLSRFEAFGAFALTEPEHGSDVAGGLGTEVVRDGQEYVITGSKRWIGMGTLPTSPWFGPATQKAARSGRTWWKAADRDTGPARSRTRSGCGSCRTRISNWIRCASRWRTSCPEPPASPRPMNC
nr:acyl-CoA dehydrogenase family protein [Arthrobacter sp. JCM 19049]